MKFIISILIGIAAVLLVVICMRAIESSRMYASLSRIPHAQAALVLGASVVRGEPSPILRNRADAAVTLYRSGVVQKILVTGDNGALSHDEVTPVRKYLLGVGVPARDIFLDHAGFDTYSSMYRARDVFKATSVIVVTQDFHLPRALWIARHLGLEAYGFVADDVRGTFTDTLREIPASFKAIADIAFGRVPKYLGPVIPLTGDGQSTWY